MATAGTKATAPFKLITSNRVEDYPGFQDHACVFMVSIMAEFHNILIRSLNSLYRSSANIAPGTQDAADLLLYGQLLCEMIETHHDWEETSYFPALETFAGKPGILGSNVEQHHAFETRLQALHNYCQVPKEQFSAEVLQALMDDLATPLGQHLHEEPFSFYKLRHFDSAGLRKVYLEQEKIVLAKGDPWKAVPLVLGSEDVTYQIQGLNGRVHPFPWYLPYLSHYIFSWRYRSVWKFNHSDSWGNPKKSHLE